MKRLLVIAAIGCGGSPPGPVAPAPAAPQPSSHESHGAGHHHHHGAKPLGHRFEQADRWVPVFDDPARDAWQQPDKVVAALALAPGMIVADIGAGTGYFERRLTTAVGSEGKVLAIDVEPDMVRYLGERAAREGLANVEAKLGTPEDPGLGPATVDRILIVDTWHHIPARAAYAKKLAAALKPGGLVLVVDFTMQTSKGPPRAHRIEQSVVISELEQGGLRAAVVDVGLPDQFVIKGER